jgi:hypothetical protein
MPTPLTFSALYDSHVDNEQAKKQSLGGHVREACSNPVDELGRGGCATLTNDPMTPMAISFSDGSDGQCVFENKRWRWPTPIPITVMVRRSDDALKWQCKTEDGRETVGSIPSTMDAKIVASAVFIDFGITMRSRTSTACTPRVS